MNTHEQMGTARESAGRWRIEGGQPNEDLLTWVRQRMAEYIKGCLECGWIWKASSATDRREMAEWISIDLFDDHDSGGRSLKLCEAAGWPT